MIRKAKPSMLALAAVLAFAAVTASAAQAGEFRAEKYPVTIEGKTIEGAVFETSSGIVKCGSISWSGVLAKAGSAVLEMTPIFEKCTKSGTDIDASGNGCRLTYELGGTIEENPDQVEAWANWTCPAGKKVEFTDTETGCVESFPPQNGMSKVTVTNNTAATPMDVKIDVAITNMHYTASATCSHPGTQNDGKWSANETRTAPGSGTGFTIT